MIGDSGVGKSSILLLFADDKFNENLNSTIGVDFRFKNITIDNKTIKIQIVRIKIYIIFLLVGYIWSRKTYTYNRSLFQRSTWHNYSI